MDDGWMHSKVARFSRSPHTLGEALIDVALRARIFHAGSALQKRYTSLLLHRKRTTWVESAYNSVNNDGCV